MIVPFPQTHAPPRTMVEGAVTCFIKFAPKKTLSTSTIVKWITCKTYFKTKNDFCKSIYKTGDHFFANDLLVLG